MSLTLGWTKPSRAVNLLERGVNAGLLDEEDGAYRAAFDPSETDIPFGFDPSGELFEPPSGSPASETDQAPTEGKPETQQASEARPTQTEDQVEAAPEPAEPDPPAAAEPGAADGVLDELLEAIAAKVEGGRKRAVATVNAKQEETGGLVTLDAAALLVAKEKGIDVREHANAVLTRLREQAA